MNKQPWKRAIAFIAGFFLLLGLVLFLSWFSFSAANKASYIYILVNDGMNNRAKTIINSSERDADEDVLLYQYFMPAWIQADPLLQRDPYANFDVSNYDYTVEISSISVRPWSTRATCELRELVSHITASAIDAPGGQSISPPQWEAQHYKVKLVRTADDRWYISELIPTQTKEINTQP